jgi:hypothetical protein
VTRSLAHVIAKLDFRLGDKDVSFSAPFLCTFCFLAFGYDPVQLAPFMIEKNTLNYFNVYAV